MPLIHEIAFRLRSPTPVDARGVALPTTLLTDGAGPFYVPIHRDALSVALEDVSQSLDVLD